MDDDVAKAKYEQFNYKDPYPEIEPALLNSADIQNYCNATGMLSPFNHKKVKSASYSACINGICWYWEEDGTKKEADLTKEGKFTLKPNSIAYVQIEPLIRLPHYIAIRFNLKITHVYRGLLLGTGPLVDPGFEGHIFIPLHNMTANSYTFNAGEDLIWIEFTKISKLPGQLTPTQEEINELNSKRIEKAVPFPENKKNRGLDYYIQKALASNQSESILSSIPVAVQQSKNIASEAMTISKQSKWVSLGTLASVVAAILAVASLFYSSWQLQREYITGVKKDLIEVIDKQKNEIDGLENKINEYQKINASQDAMLKLQEKRISSIKNDFLKNIKSYQETDNEIDSTQEKL